MQLGSFQEIHICSHGHYTSFWHKITYHELSSSAIHQPLAISLRNANQPSDGSNGCSANNLFIPYFHLFLSNEPSFTADEFKANKAQKRMCAPALNRLASCHKSNGSSFDSSLGHRRLELIFFFFFFQSSFIIRESRCNYTG
jgi:hypothetical protein